jgi:hypothetical protein
MIALTLCFSGCMAGAYDSKIEAMHPASARIQEQLEEYVQQPVLCYSQPSLLYACVQARVLERRS